MLSAKTYSMMFALNASLNGSFNASFQRAQAEIKRLALEYQRINGQLADIRGYEKQREALDKAHANTERLTTALKRYEEALQKVQKEEGNTSVQEADLQNRIDQTRMELENAQRAEGQRAERLQKLSDALKENGIDTSDTAKATEELTRRQRELAEAQEKTADSAQREGIALSEAIENAGKAMQAAGITSALEKTYAWLSECASAAREFESGMAAVMRTTGGNKSYISDLGDDFKGLSTQIPITTSELNAVAASAGQLGIARDQIESFTVTMAKLGTATDLTPDVAASESAQFANITGMTDFERYGATVAALGDSTATTASKIVEMSRGMAGAMSVAGFAETDILGFAAAVGSLGVEAQAGASSVSNVTQEIYRAVENGSDALNDYARVAGMTADEFARAWQTNAAGALTAFIEGLNDTARNGKSAITILDELGITNVRQTKVLLGLSEAQGLLSKTISQANRAWEENTALNEKAGVMYGTTEAKLTMAESAANNFEIAIGSAVNPALGELYDAFTAVMQPISEFVSDNPGLVQALAAGAAGFVAVAGGAVALTGAVKGVTLAAGVLKGLLGAATGPIGWIALAVGGASALAAGISALAADGKRDIQDLQDEFEALDSEMEKTRSVDLMIRQYSELSGKMKELTISAAETANADIEITAKPANYLTDLSFYDEKGGKIPPIEANAEKSLTGNDFVVIGDGANAVITGVAVKALPGSAFYDGSDAVITGEAVAALPGSEFYDGSDAAITGEAVKALPGSAFYDGSDAAITGEAVKALPGSAFYDNTPAEISIAPGDTTEIDRKIADYVSGKTKVITLKLGNEENVGAAINGFVSSANALSEPLQRARLEAEAANEKVETLKEEIARVNFWDENAQLPRSHEVYATRLGALQAELDAAQQQANAANEAYGLLDAEYTRAADAAEYLKDIQAQLAESAGLIADAAKSAVPGIKAEAKSTEQLAEAVKIENEARKESIRLQTLLNLNEQAENYAENAKRIGALDEKRQNAYREALRIDPLVNKPLYDYLEEVRKYVYFRDNYQYISTDELPEPKDIFEITAQYAKLPEEVKTSYPEYAPDVLLEIPAYAQDNVVNLQGMNAMNAAKLYDEAEAYSAEIDDMEAQNAAFIENVTNAAISGMIEMDEAQQTLLLAGVQNAENVVNGIGNEIEEIAREAGKVTRLEFEDATSGIIGEMQALEAEYEAVYESARESMEGQFTLFQELQRIITDPGDTESEGIRSITTDAMVGNLQAQAQYMREYAGYLEALKIAGLDEGLLKELSDGSQQSMAYIMQIAQFANEAYDGTIDEALEDQNVIEALNQAYADKQAALDEYAKTVAGLQTDFADQMNGYINEYTAAVEQMNLSEEAQEAADATLNGLIAGINGKKDAVIAAYSSVAQAAANALNATRYGAGTANALLAANAVSAERNEKYGKIGMYAQGTLYAPEGWAVVGEHGPELLRFSGGEQVIPAAESVRALSVAGGDITVQYSPVYTITGGNADDIERILREHDAELEDRFGSLIEEAAQEKARRAFA